MKRFGMCFSKDFVGETPLDHIGKKLPVYVQLLRECENKGWEVYVLTRKTYIGEGKYKGAWLFKDGKFKRVFGTIKIDIVFDWVGNLFFPPLGDNLTVVNNRRFKELACDKWAAYELLSGNMPKTIWVGDYKNSQKLSSEIQTDVVVLKPYNGLRGKGIFIGQKDKLKDFIPENNNSKFIIQEFIDTSNGIPNVTPGKHDLRIVITNKKVIWSHVRVPATNTYLANAAQGGSLTEVDYSKVPPSVKKIVSQVSDMFYRDFDNPIFSLDFGIGKDGKPYIFEINDQIGFPRVEHRGKNNFIKSLVENFESKI